MYLPRSTFSPSLSLVCGDVEGHFKQLFSRVQSILSKNKDFEVATYNGCTHSLQCAFIVPLCSCCCVLDLSLALTARRSGASIGRGWKQVIKSPSDIYYTHAQCLYRRSSLARVRLSRASSMETCHVMEESFAPMSHV